MSDWHGVSWEEMTADQKLEALRQAYATLRETVAQLRERQIQSEIDLHNRIRNLEDRLGSRA